MDGRFRRGWRDQRTRRWGRYCKIALAEDGVLERNISDMQVRSHLGVSGGLAEARRRVSLGDASSGPSGPITVGCNSPEFAASHCSAQVPGTYELPLAAMRAAQSGALQSGHLH